MKRNYERKGQPDKAGLRELLAKDGREYLLPLVNVFALAGGALDQIIDVTGRAAIEAVLEISAADVAGERQPGRRRDGGGAAHHGRQRGRVYLADRAVRVEKPRLRSPDEGEVAIPAYEALRRPSGLGERMLELLLAGLSTRSYGKATGQMAETAGVSKSSVSRQAAEAAGERLKELAERRLDDRDGRGLDPGRARLFVLDGSKALRKAVGQVFGSACLVQRRNHKMRNVTGHLPQGTPRPGESRAAGRLEAGREGRQGEDRTVRVLGGEAASGRGGKPAGRARRAVHRQRDRTDPGAAAVPGHDQRDRQRALGDAPPHRPGDPVERRVDGGALGGRLVPGRREELPQDHGIPGSLDPQGAFGRARHSPGCEKGGRFVA